MRNLKKISGGIVLIDEPELSLHPIWQVKYIDFLRDIFGEDGKMSVQFVIATHSPYILKSSPLKEVDIAVFSKRSGNMEVQKPGDGSWSLFENGPTIGEISYYAFNLPTMEFHNELYGHIQETKQKFEETEVESFLVSKGIVKDKSWIKSKKGVAQSAYDVTLMTYIRNSIHHPENTYNSDYTSQELIKSIRAMIPLAEGDT